MRRFFYPTSHVLGINKTVVISDDNYQHWCKVLRAKVGDKAVFFDGTGGEYIATLSTINKKDAAIYITDFNPKNRTNPYRTTLLQAISGTDKMDYTVQKACELGVSAIQLVITERSEQFKYERELKKLAHWQKIAISACEQCGLNLIPSVLSPVPLEKAVIDDTSELKLVLDFLPTPLSDSLPKIPPNNISLLIGAEGGLSDDEIHLAKTHGFTPLYLGERILRTETASVVAMASLASFYQ